MKPLYEYLHFSAFVFHLIVSGALHEGEQNGLEFSNKLQNIRITKNFWRIHSILYNYLKTIRSHIRKRTWNETQVSVLSPTFVRDIFRKNKYSTSYPRDWGKDAYIE